MFPFSSILLAQIILIIKQQKIQKSLELKSNLITKKKNLCEVTRQRNGKKYNQKTENNGNIDKSVIFKNVEYSNRKSEFLRVENEIGKNQESVHRNGKNHNVSEKSNTPIDLFPCKNGTNNDYQNNNDDNANKNNDSKNGYHNHNNSDNSKNHKNNDSNNDVIVNIDEDKDKNDSYSYDKNDHVNSNEKPTERVISQSPHSRLIDQIRMKLREKDNHNTTPKSNTHAFNDFEREKIRNKVDNDDEERNHKTRIENIQQNFGVNLDLVGKKEKKSGDNVDDNNNNNNNNDNNNYNDNNNNNDSDSNSINSKNSSNKDCLFLPAYSEYLKQKNKINEEKEKKKNIERNEEKKNNEINNTSEKNDKNSIVYLEHIYLEKEKEKNISILNPMSSGGKKNKEKNNEKINLNNCSTDSNDDDKIRKNDNFEYNEKSNHENDKVNEGKNNDDNRKNSLYKKLNLSVRTDLYVPSDSADMSISPPPSPPPPPPPFPPKSSVNKNNE